MSRKSLLVLFSTLALGAFLRFSLITEIPLGLFPDEAVNGNNAAEALATKTFKIFYPENNGREGLFINMQALSVRFFGNQPWALRVVSALFGTLTILALFLLTKEIFSSGQAAAIGLLSSFFLATSYWHLNFSRIGFRAILVPFFAVFAMYFLLKGLRRGSAPDMLLAGIFAGLGFYTYIAFRFMVFVFAVPVVWHLKNRYKSRNAALHATPYTLHANPCIPCLAALFIFITFVVALPIGFYFLQHPQDFFGRGGQVSIFSSDRSTLFEFGRSNLAAVAMLFVRGDCNPRHNFACQPELHPLVALFFLIGIIITIRNLFENRKLPAENCTLIVWLVAMSLPATLTREGLPHALRSIGMIPPVMILSGLGAWTSLSYILNWFESQKSKWPQYIEQLGRIQKEATILFALILLLIPLKTYRDYFIRWAESPDAYRAFATDVLHIGQYLNGLPAETRKYVITQIEWPRLREVGTPAQTVMFATNTFRDESRREKQFEYLTRDQIQNISALSENQKTVIALFNGDNREFIKNLQKKFPELHIKVPGDFVILETP